MRDVSQKSGISDTLVEARGGLFRATLLFGSIAVALAMIVVPTADHQAKLVAAERVKTLDTVTTGSSVRSDKKHYVSRLSVLTDPDKGPCLLFPDGTQRGAC
ncbi:hypothetical protein Sa4125_36480 [Aureimonas sp. SA4125]|uniref:hypothetical protein n=1 Tax=Aureimonas sp. SA4125 TaxID=2826993 RepID=UPI001CC4147D|nr:hypothetical protein [Aureimonas sp. SA4125]BDA86106.1 hypothetical protein Sa4125_36480 [Aureimonas sp. SA4125]